MILKEQIENIYRLGVKELISLRSDLVLVSLIIYVFTIAVYTVSIGASTDLEYISVAIVDEDHSPLSHRIYDSLLGPYFQQPTMITLEQIDETMDAGKYSFIIDIPPDFQRDFLARRQPTIQLNVDATAMSQAGTGANYIQNLISREIIKFMQGHEGEPELPAEMVIRVKFNPNLKSSWFLGVMQIIMNITLLAIVLTGAAIIREREHGTIEHLLVMPLKPVEIMLAKVWANGFVIVLAATISLYLVVQWLLEVPIAGSITLFIIGTVIYLFSVTALGILLATVANSMPQFGLLSIPVFIFMNLLSGISTPFESMPELLQNFMQISPSTHFVSFAQAVLYRGAGLKIVWCKLIIIFVLGTVFFTVALLRFRKTISVTK